MSTFDPLKNSLFPSVNKPLLNDHILKTGGNNGQTLALEEKKGGCLASLFICKMIHWVRHSDERISRVRAVFDNLLSKSNLPLSDSAHLLANATYFNEKVIRKHNSTWASFFMFWSRIPLLETKHHQTSIWSLITGHLSDLNQFSKVSFKDKTRVLFNAYAAYKDMAPIEEIQNQTPLALKSNRAALLKEIQKVAPQYIDLFKAEVQRLIQKKDQWTPEDIHCALVLDEFIKGPKFEQLKELEHCVDLNNYKAIWETFFANYEKETKSFSELQQKLSADYSKLQSICSKVISTQDFLEINRLPSYQKEMEAVLTLPRITEKDKANLEAHYETYTTLLNLHGKIVGIMQKFKNCKTTDLAWLQIEIETFNAQIPSTIKALATNLLAIPNSYYQVVKKTQSIFDEWLTTEQALSSKFVEEKDLQPLQNETASIKQFIPIPPPPFVGDLDAVRSRVMETIKGRDLEYTGWKRKIKEHMNALQSSGYYIILTKVDSQPNVPAFDKTAFEAYLSKLPASAKKDELSKEFNTLQEVEKDYAQIVDFYNRANSMVAAMTDGHRVTSEDIESLKKMKEEKLPTWAYRGARDTNVLLCKVYSRMHELAEIEAGELHSKLDKLQRKFYTDCSAAEEFAQHCESCENALKRFSELEALGKQVNYYFLEVNSMQYRLDATMLDCRKYAELYRTFKNLERDVEALSSGKECRPKDNYLDFSFRFALPHPLLTQYQNLHFKYMALLSCQSAERRFRTAVSNFLKNPDMDTLKRYDEELAAAKDAAWKTGHGALKEKAEALNTIINQLSTEVAPKKLYLEAMIEAQPILTALNRNHSYKGLNVRSLQFFAQNYGYESPYRTVQKLLTNSLLEASKRAGIQEELKKTFSEAILNNVAVMEKAANYWKSEESGKLNASELEVLKGFQNNPAIPLAFQVQAGLILRSHTLNFHPKTTDVISMAPLTDAVEAKNHLGHFYNRSTILRWIHMKGTNPLNRNSLKAEDLQDRPDITQLVQDWHLCKDILLKPELVKASASIVLIDEIKDMLSPEAQNYIHAFENSIHRYGETQNTHKFKVDIHDKLSRKLQSVEGIDPFKGLILECNATVHNLLSNVSTPDYAIASLVNIVLNLDVISAVFESMDKADPEKLKRLKMDLEILQATLGNAAAFSEAQFDTTMNFTQDVACDAMIRVYEIIKGMGPEQVKLYLYVNHLPVYVPSESERKRFADSQIHLFSRMEMLKNLVQMENIRTLSNYTDFVKLIQNVCQRHMFLFQDILVRLQATIVELVQKLSVEVRIERRQVMYA